ncbi:MAG: MoaD/ThiS family protein, partial [Planctomycetota bacterium]|jgi:molybdopterin converting factor small subunit
MNMQGMIGVNVRLTGPVADLVGHKSLEYSLTQMAQLGGLVALLYAKHPKLADKSASVQIEHNGQPANMGADLAEGDEVVISLQKEE